MKTNNNLIQATLLWDTLIHIPTKTNENNETVINKEWNVFPKNTPIQDIWRWFENKFKVKITEDLMFPSKIATKHKYAIVDYEVTGLLQVQSLNGIDDEFCAFLAERNNDCKIIPINELPITLPENLKYYGWVDTIENRKNLEKYAKKYMN